MVTASRPRRYRGVICALLTLMRYAATLQAEDTAIAVAWNARPDGGGMLAAISPSAPWELLRPPIPIGKDTVLHAAFGRLYALSSSDRTVRVINPATWSVERSYPLPSRDEPVDLKVVSPGLAYVTRRNAPQLLRLDLASGMTQVGVDLSILADDDGNPDQGNMIVHDGRLFIQLERLNFDNPPPYPAPFIAVMDLTTEQLVDVNSAREGLQAIELEGTFPKMKMQVIEQSRKLFVSASGGFFDAGGIEVINLDNLQSEGLAIREADGLTGADLGAFVMVAGDRGFLAYSTDLLLSSHLHQFSMSGGVDNKELAVTLDYFSPAIEFHPATNSVFFPVNGALESGLHVFDATTGVRLNDRLIETSGPPTDLVLLTAIPEPAAVVLFASMVFALLLNGKLRKLLRYAG